jgi:8-amino-7-oxononanoate synthase
MFKHELIKLKNQHLLRRLSTVESYNGPYVTINGRKLLLMCSNDYLGLAGHPALREAASAAMEQYGFGSGGSRLVSGSSALHQELDQKIAKFKGTEAALAFNSGYTANTGIIPAMVGEGDMVLSDSLNHASIIDGCRLSKAEVKVYRHRDIDHVKDLLKKSPSARRTLIVTDGVFSMDGDIAALPELASLAEKYGAVLMVDDAHATGVLGNTGRGTAEYFGLTGQIPVQMGTFSKALGSFGAFVAGDRALIDYLVNRSRSFIFSTALPPMVCAASIAALDVIDREPERRENLRRNKARFVLGMLSLGIAIADSKTPIVPLMIGASKKALQVSEKLLEYGIYAAAVRPPAVPEGTARIRTTITATHTAEDIDKALDIFDRLKCEGYL